MALKERSKLRIDILGQEYVLKGTDSPEYLKKVGNFVSDKMDQVYKNNPIYGPTKIAVLVSLQIADEYQKLKDDYEKIVEELRVLDKIHKIG
ncbi:cell division protein ZapA [Dehalobacterium formicoaceticum]|uniref:Cell division protein ZapA n=1 Tax=Dehalobacterium formicoaceticum TaxID=51515 RepID=A0ABT1Y7G5_9FIRM|nr:cell division protein ZapA [Dehalobacterium formicoaceticum]MCR6546823.1 cell division protein ZapA [Dehalobacterium formicoaceticum]